MIKEFNDIGVNTSFLEINKKITTGSNFIITNLDNLNSTVLNYHTNDVVADVDIDIEPEDIEKSDNVTLVFKIKLINLMN